MIRVTVPGRLEDVGSLRTAVLGLADTCAAHPDRPSPELLYAWALAVYEAGTNVVLHGLTDIGPAPIELAIELLRGHVAFWLLDHGHVNREWGAARTPEALDEHGRGLAIIRAVMEAAAYGRADDGRNVLLMLGRLGGATPA